MYWLGFSNTQDFWVYGGLLCFFVAGIIFSLLFLTLAFLRGGYKKNAEKDSAYECGFSPSTSLTSPISIRFALIAILFIVFDIEIALLFPWAMTFRELGWVGFGSVSVFLGILGLGFVYELASGALNWE